MTYNQAIQIILDRAVSMGWTVIRHNASTCKPMKVPHATDPHSRERWYFKPQSIHISKRDHNGCTTDLAMKHARSTHIDVKQLAKNILNGA